MLLTRIASIVLAGAVVTQAAKRAANDELEDYDYVVVGSGPGGGPLASRLAIAGHKVLLIDAGGDEGESLTQQIPALHLFASEYVPQSWEFFVQHYADEERQAQDSKMVYELPSGDRYVGLNPPEGAKPLGIFYPRAGTLGGCASHNALISIYPFESDWNYIASLTGDSSWSAENMRTYFERLESNEYLLPTSVVGHGFSGWLSTSLTDLILVLQDLKVLSLVISAATAMGQTVVGKIINTVAGLAEILLIDLNNPAPTRDHTEGVYQVPLSMHSHTRDGPRGFILDTANATNLDGSRKYRLDIKLNTLVTKIRFDESGERPHAVGVDFLEGQSLYRADPRFSSSSTGTPGSVNATKEVIISGGSFNTPQILKLSGIGPKDELDEFDIPVVKDLPGLGTNLQDHHETTVIGEAESDFVLTKDCTFIQSLPDPCLEQWETKPLLRGAYGTNGLAIAVIKKSSQASADEDPDILISGAPAYFPGYFPGYAEAAVAERNHWSWITLKAHTHNNAGTVRLRSTDPQDTPLITFNLYDTGTTDGGGDVKDVEAQVEGMEQSRQMFDDLIPLDGRFEEVWPGRNVTGDELRDFIKNEAWGHHASCTCPIGADGDAMAVLDSKFRVRGVDALRVVDASVFPKIPGTFTVIPVYMISEKAADSILEDA